jgi:hypothetical protein
MKNPSKFGCGTIIFILFLSFAFFKLINDLHNSNQHETSPQPSSDIKSKQKISLTPEQQVAEDNRRIQEEKERQEQIAVALGLRWQYFEESDGMGRGTVKRAVIYSLNNVEFDFPYQGPQRAALELRIHPRYGHDVILSIQKGQFFCSSLNCRVAVRFDNNKVQHFPTVRPADHSTTVLFLRNYSKFIAAARKSKKVRIEAQFFRQGTRVFEFDISGLKW